jgi:hypothetical protein
MRKEDRPRGRAQARGKEPIPSWPRFRCWQTVRSGQILDDVTKAADIGAPTGKGLSMLWLCAGPEETAFAVGASTLTSQDYRPHRRNRAKAEVCGGRRDRPNKGTEDLKRRHNKAVLPPRFRPVCRRQISETSAGRETGKGPVTFCPVVTHLSRADQAQASPPHVSCLQQPNSEDSSGPTPELNNVLERRPCPLICLVFVKLNFIWVHRASQTANFPMFRIVRLSIICHSSVLINRHPIDHSQ